ncbi:MAG: hypothetical protein R3B47_18330 [Bacteroidia bacterium]
MTEPFGVPDRKGSAALSLPVTGTIFEVLDIREGANYTGFEADAVACLVI